MFVIKLGMRSVPRVAYAPKEVETVLRSKTIIIQEDGTEVVRNYLFLLNYAKEEKLVEIRGMMEDVFSGEMLEDHVKLERYGVRCLVWEE